MEGKNIVDLVNLYQEFSEQHGGDDLGAFSVWLNRRLYEREFPEIHRQPDPEENRFIVYHIHRLSKYFRWYAKGFLNRNGLNSMDEYFFLVSIHHRKTPSKNEVYRDTITEVTTGAQMMKRLVEIGMIKELTDGKDKRIKRVKLTAKGQKTRLRIFEQSKRDLLFKAGNLNAAERHSLKESLVYLEKFHGDIYHHDYHSSTEEILKKYCFVK